MIAAPRLSETDVRIEVERIFRRDHRSRLVALFGRGDTGRFELNGDAWIIVPTTCELALRATLPGPADDPSLGRAYLIDWAEDVLPLDIACRLAGGRIYHIARDVRLAAMFGARQAEPGLVGTNLARLLLSGAVEGLRKISGLVLTRDDAWRRFLQARLDMPEDTVGNARTLLAWTRSSDGGPAFFRQSEADETWRAVRRELLEWLAGALGPVGVLAWRAWEAGQTDRLLQVMALLVAGNAIGDPYARGRLGGQVDAWLPSLGGEFRNAQPALEDGVILPGVLNAAAPADRRLLLEAQNLAGAADLAAVSAASDWLPAGHTAREDRLAALLDAFSAEPSATALDAFLAAREELAAHRLDAEIRPSEQGDARIMAARLATWLLARRVRSAATPYGSPWLPVVELACGYAEEGGYLDWARQTLRAVRIASPALAAAVRRLLALVDVEVREDDHRFAGAYISWLNAGKPSADVVPIEHVVKRIVSPFLQGATNRRLLVVLMDGMSQTSAIQILHRLRDQHHWNLIAWRSPSWSGRLPLPPVLAATPTLTQVSRSAFFAGSTSPSFGHEGTDRDGERWASNPGLQGIAGSTPPPLFFRRDILAGHDLADDVKEAIASPERPVVAVVVNAIDEQLSGSIQVGVDYSRTPILPLEALLGAAEGAERAILLVADHGHVPGDALRVIPGRLDADRPGGARWRALAEGQGPEPEEVRLPGSCWKPRGWNGVAVLWDASVAYRSPMHGEHGGLSLAETVAPAFLVGPEWLDRVQANDADLSSHPLPTPEWWDLHVPRPQAATPTVPAPIRQPPVQMPLIPAIAGVVPATAPAPALVQAAATPRTAEPQLVRDLRASPIFRGHVRGHPEPELERVLRWLGTLVDAGGVLPSADFARRCGVRAHQVGGVVARMGILNADGFTVIEHDVVGRRVLLHRARLTQQYGVRE